MKNNRINLSDVGFCVYNLVGQAGIILSEFFYSQRFSSRQKSGFDFTTEADEKVDKFLRDNLKKEYPCSEFLTEETAPKDYPSFINAENLWVIDPLDGTANFARGNSNFAISVALMNKGKSVVGAVYKPIAKKFYYTRANFEADSDYAYSYSGLQGENDYSMDILETSKTPDLKEAVVACDWPWDLDKRGETSEIISGLCQYVRQIKCMGSAASDLMLLAEGKIDAYFHSGVKPWDVAAAALIIEKAGGVVMSLDGDDWSVFNGTILASNKPLNKKIRRIIDLVGM